MNGLFEIVKLSEIYINNMCEIAYEQYKNEQQYNSYMKELSMDEFFTVFKKTVKDSKGLVALSDNKVIGYLMCKSNHIGKGINYIYISQLGYGCVGKDRIKIMSQLFQEFARGLSGKVHFEIKIYAHDNEILRIFSFMQFGIQCQQGICRVSSEEIIENYVAIRRIAREELNQRWYEVWSLLRKLIGHLRQSPIFYPSNEFTEEVYKEFFLDNDTNVFIAEKSGKLVGVIETNSSANDILTNNISCSNIGDIYVQEEYRGSNIAHNLFLYANAFEKNNGTEFLWVEHGTANPNARGFWNRYFKPYVYTMIRDVEVINISK